MRGPNYGILTNALHAEDSVLPLQERFGSSLMIAFRPWEFGFFQEMRRSTERKVFLLLQKQIKGERLLSRAPYNAVYNRYVAMSRLEPYNCGLTRFPLCPKKGATHVVTWQ